MCVCVCVCVCVYMCVRRCRQSVCTEFVCPWSAVFLSAPASEHLQSCLYICLHVCLLSGRLPIEALVRLSVCRPHLLVFSAALQPVCLRLLLSGDKRASWQPEAICHPGPFCSAPVRCLLLVCPSLVFPLGSTHKPNPKKRFSLLVRYDARRELKMLIDHC